jgi:hypothetical protein
MFILTPLSIGVWRMQYARIQYGPVPARVWGTPWYIATLLGCIPLGILILIRIYRTRQKIHVHQNGLMVQFGWRTKRGVPWEKISGVSVTKVRNTFLGFKFRNQYKIELHPTVGNPIQISRHIQKLDELSARIKAKIYPKLIKELRSSLNSGQNLYFGEIALNLQGIKIKTKEYLWDQVSMINIRSGFLVVELTNHRAKRIPVGKIPNIELVLQIIQEGVEA